MKRRLVARSARALLIIIIGYLVLRLFEYSQVYHPDRYFRSTGAELGRPFQDVRFTASDGVALHGWFYPADTNSDHRQLAVLVCHGNAGNIGDRLDVCAAFLSAGVNVFLFDYRGYGQSEGRPSEQGTYLDAQAAHEWLQNKGFAPGEIIVHGESLGGGVASELATRETVAALVLQSTFTSITDLGAELFPWLPVRWLATIHYDTRSKLSRIHVPVLILHGREDTLVRFRHAERNFAAANEPKFLEEMSGDHNDGIQDRNRFLAGFRKLLACLPDAAERTK